MKLSTSITAGISILKDFKTPGSALPVRGRAAVASRRQRISIRNVITPSPEPAVTRSPYW